MKPCNRLYRRLVEFVIVRKVRVVFVAYFESSIVLNVNLLDASETAKLTFDPVVIAVMITVGRREFRLPPLIRHGRFFDYMNWKRHFCDPGLPCELVGDVEFRRRRITDCGLGT